MKGSNSRSGRPPDPNALRRDRVPIDWTLLPAAGRLGVPPPWPLTRPTARELVFWEREWSRPQAIAWQHNRQELEVALYVRSLVAAERPDARITMRTLVRQQQDALGLTAPGLRSNRWAIIDDIPTPAPKAASTSAKDRFRVIPEDDPA